MPSRMSVGDALSDYSSELAGAFSDVPLPYALPEPASAMPHAECRRRRPDRPPERAVGRPGRASRDPRRPRGDAGDIGRSTPSRHISERRSPTPGARRASTRGTARTTWGRAASSATISRCSASPTTTWSSPSGSTSQSRPPNASRSTSSMTIGANHELFEAIQAATPARSFAPAPNELYRRIAAIAQPGYVDDPFPRHPARAVMDLKQSLAPETLVSPRSPVPPGLWVARTFPTDRMGTVVVPAVDRSGVAAAVALRLGCGAAPTPCASSTDGVDDVIGRGPHGCRRPRAAAPGRGLGRRRRLVAHRGPRRRRRSRRSVDGVSDTPGRVAAVTGASSGIGRAIAVALGALGWKVALGARRTRRPRTRPRSSSRSRAASRARTCST